MKENFKKMKIASKNALRFLGVLSIPVLIATVMKTVACFTDLNYATGYFRIGILSTVSAYIAAAVCIASISYLFISKSTVPLTRPTGALSFIPGGMASAAQFFLSAELFSSFISKADENGVTLGVACILALAILSVFSALSFFFAVFYEKRENTMKAAYLIAAVAFFAAYAAHLYFDSTTPLNSPAKIADQMAYLAAAVFFLYETRVSLGRSIWRAHTAFGIIAAAICFYASLPALILFFAKGILITKSLASAVLLFTLGICALAKVILYSVSEREEESPTAATVRAIADKRAEEISSGITRERSRGVAEDESIGENYQIKIPTENEDGSAQNEEESAE